MMKVVIEREQFTSTRVDALGLVVGLQCSGSDADDSDGCAVVVGQCACVPSSSPLPSLEQLGLPTPDWPASVERVTRHFPAGCAVCGVYVRVEGCSSECVKTVVEIICNHSNFLAAAHISGHTTSKQLLVVSMAMMDDQSDSLSCYTVDVSSSVMGADVSVDLQQCGISSLTATDCLASQTRMLRVQASFDVFVSTEKPLSMMDSLLHHLWSSSVIFYLPSHEQFLGNNQSDHSNLTLGNILKSSPQTSLQTPLPVEVFEDTSQGSEIETLYAPKLIVERVVGPVVKVVLPVDVVGVFALCSPTHEVVADLKTSMAAQLKTMRKAIVWKKGTPSSVKAYHFPLPNQLCPITVVYPHVPLGGGEEERIKDSDLLEVRKELHLQFNLPATRPHFRTINRTCFDTSKGSRLINPHASVKYTRVTDGTVALVQGTYVYYHYSQDRCDDNGWGCAYRSLQTLWSWFVMQGYTTQPTPSHRQIQQALVDVGDKEPSLIGSRQWIGSFEVSTCLNHLLGVVSKIHHCSRGEDMAGVGRVLLNHFQTQGTPVMIGGGVLAHTILGVDFSEKTGEIQFLILDPHYTGWEDTRTVTEKGWCGWKPVTFWDQQAHYNLCMPQCPDEF